MLLRALKAKGVDLKRAAKNDYRLTVKEVLHPPCNTLALFRERWAGARATDGERGIHLLKRERERGGERARHRESERAKEKERERELGKIWYARGRNTWHG